MVSKWYHIGHFSPDDHPISLELGRISDVTSGKNAGLTLGLPKATMDLYKAIQDLYAEKEKLERVIASLEELQRTAGAMPILPKAAKRRGRKSMSPTERQEVSERMRKYWANRRGPEKAEKAGSSDKA
jgi:hypothetical protein